MKTTQLQKIFINKVYKKHECPNFFFQFVFFASTMGDCWLASVVESQVLEV